MTETEDITDIATLQEAMLGLPQADCPVLHHFANGVYIRELRMAAGVFAIGRHQKHKHMNIFLKGKVAVYTEDGVNVIQAPMIFEGEPGKKVGYVLEDMVWLNVYPNTDEIRDIDTLEDTWMERMDDQQPQDRTEDVADFKDAIHELGFSESEVWDLSDRTEDTTQFPKGFDSLVSVRDSAIHGKGLFSNGGFKAGDFIAPGRIDGLRTPAGRYTNHSKNPNAKFHTIDNGDIYLVATQDISGCKGGDTGVEITVCYRKAFRESR